MTNPIATEAPSELPLDGVQCVVQTDRKAWPRTPSGELDLDQLERRADGTNGVNYNTYVSHEDGVHIAIAVKDAEQARRDAAMDQMDATPIKPLSGKPSPEVVAMARQIGAEIRGMDGEAILARACGEVIQMPTLNQPDRPAPAPFGELDPDALSKMPPSRLGRLLADLLGTPAVCRESGIVYHYDDGVWQPVPDAKLTPMLARVFDSVDCPYSSRKLKGAVETMKDGLPDMAWPSMGLIGFANGVYDLKAASFRPHSPENFLPSHNGITYGELVAGENLKQHAPSFNRWLTHAAGGNVAKMDRIKAALFMVLANRYDWQMFLEVTGEGGSGKSVMANLCEFLVGKENVGCTSMEAMRGLFGLENVWDKRLILLPDQSQYIGDGALLKAITGGDEVLINRKNKAQFNAKVRAVVIATNNEPMKMTERNGGISRRRVIFAFNNVVSEANKDTALGDKIAAELPVIIRHLLAQFADPEQARQLLLEQRDGAEALAVKQEADPVIAMCALLEFLNETTGLRVGGGNGVHDPVRFLYHFYLEYLKAEGLDRPLHRTAFGKAMKAAAKAYGEEYQTRKSNGDRVTNVKLKDEARSVLPQARLLDD